MHKSFGLMSENIDLKKISDFYNKRFEKTGETISSVGWKNYSDQDLRFSQLLRDVDFEGKTILDFGCGLGHLVSYLEKKSKNFHYVGVDISKKLIDSARSKHTGGNILFYEGEIDQVYAISKKRNLDIILSSGTFSYNIKNMKNYTKEAIRVLFEISEEIVSINFLSNYVDYELKKNIHFSPEEMFKYSKGITNKVNLFNDYPLYEFTLQLKK